MEEMILEQGTARSERGSGERHSQTFLGKENSICKGPESGRTMAVCGNRL